MFYYIDNNQRVFYTKIKDKFYETDNKGYIKVTINDKNAEINNNINFNLDLILEKEKSKFSLKTVELLKICHKKLLKLINDWDNKGIILSSVDIGDYIENFMKKKHINDSEELINKYLDNAIDYLINQNLKSLIYEANNKESYINQVRNQGKLSLSEYHMRKTLIRSTHTNIKTIFKDTEFPISPDGKYIF